MTLLSPTAQPLPASAPVLVIGAGAMGRGIALVAASAGHPVTLYDLNPGQLEAAQAAIADELSQGLSRGRLTAEAAAATAARIAYTTDYTAAAPAAALVIEAIVEELTAKQTLFRDLEALVSPNAILATNTSSLSITAIGSALARPERLVGMHFFNPATRMKLVEVVSGLATAPEVAAAILATAEAWGKVAVAARSTPGFIVNRVARPYYGEALRLLLEQAADCATIDAVLTEAGGFPMGPFALMDLIGNDVNAAVTRSVWTAYGFDPRFQPSLIQEELVAAGRLGRKSRQGFYDYRPGAPRPTPQTAAPQPLLDETVTLVGQTPELDALAERWRRANLTVKRVTAPTAPRIDAHGVRLCLTDGRPAAIRAAEEETPSLALTDWVRNWASATRIAVTFAPTTPREGRQQAVALLQAAGFAVSEVADVAGLIFARTQAMLANEAADACQQGVASAEAIDLAMRFGTNYPEGPLAWAARVGEERVVALLTQLLTHTGDPRYRLSPYLKRRAAEGRLTRAPYHLG